MANENTAPVQTTPSVEATPSGEAPATASAATSDVAAIARANKAKRIAKPAPAPVAAQPVQTRAEILAELKAAYEADPEALISTVAGEDFRKLAERVAKKSAPPTEAEKLAALTKDVEAFKAREAQEEAKREATAKEEADARTAKGIEGIATVIEEANEDGSLKYPTLATLDPQSVEEDPAVTAFNAVCDAWQIESTREDGSFVPAKWDEATTEAKCRAALEGLEAHYAKIRTPKPRSAKTQEASSDVDPSLFHSANRVAEPTARKPPKKNMTVDEAIRFYTRGL